jgi:hypothetical protein
MMLHIWTFAYTNFHDTWRGWGIKRVAYRPKKKLKCILERTVVRASLPNMCITYFAELKFQGARLVECVSQHVLVCSNVCRVGCSLQMSCNNTDSRYKGLVMESRDIAMKHAVGFQGANPVKAAVGDYISVSICHIVMVFNIPSVHVTHDIVSVDASLLSAYISCSCNCCITSALRRWHLLPPPPFPLPLPLSLAPPSLPFRPHHRRRLVLGLHAFYSASKTYYRNHPTHMSLPATWWLVTTMWLLSTEGAFRRSTCSGDRLFAIPLPLTRTLT